MTESTEVEYASAIIELNRENDRLRLERAALASIVWQRRAREKTLRDELEAMTAYAECMERDLESSDAELEKRTDELQAAKQTAGSLEQTVLNLSERLWELRG